MPDRERYERAKGSVGSSGARTMRARIGIVSRAMVVLVLSMALALGLCPSWAGIVPQAQAADATGLEADGFTFDVVDGAAYVKRTSLKGTVVIPAMLNGYPVKGVKEDTTVSGAEFVGIHRVAGRPGVHWRGHVLQLLHGRERLASEHARIRRIPRVL